MKSAFLVSKGLLCLHDKQNKTWLLVDMEFLFLCSTRHLTRSLRSLVSHRVKHSKRNSISTRAMYYSLFIQTFRSVKTTAYDQNTSIQWYFHIFKAQKSSKSGQTVQGIVQSVFESLSMKWNRRFWGLTMFVFNFGVASLEQSVKPGRLVIFDFLGNSLL